MNFIYKLMANRHVRKLLKIFNLDKPVILCVGDSLTYGTCAPKGCSYPSWLQAILKMPVINAGIPGSTSANWPLLIDTYLKKWRPDVVIFCIGTNDQMLKVDEEEVFKNISQTIARILLSGAKIVFIQPEHIDGYPAYSEIWNRLGKASKINIMMFGAMHFVKDIVTNDKKNVAADGVHLTAIGYHHLSSVVAAALHYCKMLDFKVEEPPCQQ